MFSRARRFSKLGRRDAAHRLFIFRTSSLVRIADHRNHAGHACAWTLKLHRADCVVRPAHAETAQSRNEAATRVRRATSPSGLAVTVQDDRTAVARKFNHGAAPGAAAVAAVTAVTPATASARLMRTAPQTPRSGNRGKSKRRHAAARAAIPGFLTYSLVQALRSLLWFAL